MLERYCQYKECGKVLVRRREANGYFETDDRFNTRKYCNRKCYTDAKPGIFIKDEVTSGQYHKRARHCAPGDGLCQMCHLVPWEQVHCPSCTIEDIKDLSNNRGMYLCHTCHGITRRSVASDSYTKHCRIPECNNPHEALGYCNMHYMRLKKHGDPLRTDCQHQHSDICSIPGCGGQFASRGYCDMHYRRYLKYGDPLIEVPIGRPKENEICSIPGCGRPYWGLGFCAMHHTRFKRYGDPNIIFDSHGNLKQHTELIVCATVEEVATLSDLSTPCDVVVDKWLSEQLRSNKS